MTGASSEISNSNLEIGMSVRTCQLCGKPLSRIRVGGGSGEFCSREHRNQYRLRRGMDQLEEANALASVMRRREQLKPLAPQPALSGGRERRLGPALQSGGWMKSARTVLARRAAGAAWSDAPGAACLQVCPDLFAFPAQPPQAHKRASGMAQPRGRRPAVRPPRIVKVSSGVPCAAARPIAVSAQSGWRARVPAKIRAQPRAAGIRPAPAPQAPARWMGAGLCALAIATPGGVRQFKPVTVRFEPRDALAVYFSGEGE